MSDSHFPGITTILIFSFFVLSIPTSFEASNFYLSFPDSTFFALRTKRSLYFFNLTHNSKITAKLKQKANTPPNNLALIISLKAKRETIQQRITTELIFNIFFNKSVSKCISMIIFSNKPQPYHFLLIKYSNTKDATRQNPIIATSQRLSINPWQLYSKQ